MRDSFGHNEAVTPNQSAAGGAHTLLAVGGERDIGAAGVPAVQRPLRLAVADDKGTGSRHGGGCNKTVSRKPI